MCVCSRLLQDAEVRSFDFLAEIKSSFILKKFVFLVFIMIFFVVKFFSASKTLSLARSLNIS